MATGKDNLQNQKRQQTMSKSDHSAKMLIKYQNATTKSAIFPRDTRLLFLYTLLLRKKQVSPTNPKINNTACQSGTNPKKTKPSQSRTGEPYLQCDALGTTGVVLPHVPNQGMVGKTGTTKLDNHTNQRSAKKKHFR